MTDELAQKRIQKLTDKGIDHLTAGRYQEALKVSAEVEDADGRLAFYLAGEAYAGMNDLKNAIASMRRGVLITPTFWVNWHYLGVYLTRLKKSAEALAAFNQALLCPQADPDTIHLSMVTAFMELKEFNSALTCLDGIDRGNTQWRWSVDGTRVVALEGAGRVSEAVELAEEFLKERPEGDEEYDKWLGFVVAALARIRLRQGQSSEEVREFLLQCLEEHGCNGKVLYEIRCLNELRYSEDSKHFHIVIDARVSEKNPWYREAPGYYIAYDVVSDTETQACEMINDFERAIGTESFEVMNCEILEERREDPLGVYWISERVFYGS